MQGLRFVMWFGSGVVMMSVGFPQLTMVERFNGLVFPRPTDDAPRVRYLGLIEHDQIAGWELFSISPPVCNL
jgi:hypothetical protein